MFWKKQTWPKVDRAAAQHRARILVIDDKEFLHEDQFKAHEYNITKRNDLDKLEDLEEGKYDILLLDLKGVGADFSSEEGVGVLRHLRERNPSLVVIVFSSSKWDMNAQQTISQADAVLHKSSEFLEFKRVVDHWIERRLTLDFYIERARTIAPDAMQIEGISARLEAAILASDGEKLRSFMDKRRIDTQTIEALITLTAFAAKKIFA